MLAQAASNLSIVIINVAIPVDLQHNCCSQSSLEHHVDRFR